MAWRKHPEISAFEEGQQEAENWLELLAEGHGGFSSLQEAIQHYGEAASNRLQNTTDPEQREQLQGYLSKLG